jgi:hypothetical protein
MRFAPQPVKLRIANVFDKVCRFRFKYAAARNAILALKNARIIDLFLRIVPFQRTAKTAPGDREMRHRVTAKCATGNVDGNGTLPYKPRQLSAMTRSDRGGSSWAAKRPALGRPSTDLPHYQAGCRLSAAILSAENHP